MINTSLSNDKPAGLFATSSTGTAVISTLLWTQLGADVLFVTELPLALSLHSGMSPAARMVMLGLWLAWAGSNGGAHVSSMTQPKTLPQRARITALIVSSDPNTARTMADAFDAHEIGSATAADLEAATLALSEGDFDVVTADCSTPGQYDLNLCYELARRTGLPLIAIAAQADPMDRIIALEMGADDLMSLPLDARALVARTRALVRRTHRPPPAPDAGRPDGPGREFHVDPETLSLWGPTGVRVPVSRRQVVLLDLLRNGPAVMTARTVAEATRSPVETDLQFRGTIAKLRRKMIQAGLPYDTIQAVRGAGYTYALHAAGASAAADE